MLALKQISFFITQISEFYFSDKLLCNIVGFC